MNNRIPFRWWNFLPIHILFLLSLSCSKATIAAQTKPTNASPIAQIEALIKRGELELAEQKLKKLAAQARSAKIRKLLGDVLLAQGKTDEAQAAYEGVVKNAPGDAEANLALARMYLDSGKFQESLDAAGRIPIAKRTVALLPVLAAAYLGLQQQDKAAAEISAMLEVAGKNPELVPQLAEFFLAHGAARDAAQLLKAAEAKQKHTDRFALDTARAQAAIGNRMDARETLAGLLEASPGYVDALTEAGRIAGLDSDWLRAIEYLSRAETLAPERVDILQGLCMAQLYAQRSEDALRTGRKLEEKIPDDLRTAYFLALALLGNRQWEAARPYAEKVLQAHPEDREMNLVLANVTYNLRDLVGARKYIAVCIKENANDPGALYYLGLVQKNEGDLKDAMESLGKSAAGNPGNLEAQRELGALRLQTGDAEGARQPLEKAVELAPRESQNHYQLALAYRRTEMKEKAREQLALYNQLKAEEQKRTLPASSEAAAPTPQAP